MTPARPFSLGGSSRLGLLLTAILAVVTGVLVFVALRQNADSGDGTRAGAGGGAIIIVTAKQDIAARTELTDDMLELTTIPGEAVLAGAFTDRSLVVGQMARQPIYRGEQFVPVKVAGGKRGR